MGDTLRSEAYAAGARTPKQARTAAQRARRAAARATPAAAARRPAARPCAALVRGFGGGQAAAGSAVE